MKTSAFLVGLAVLVLFIPTTSFSSPTSLGPTGILNVPTAETVTPGDVELQFGYDRPKVADQGIDVFPIGTISYGFRNGEVGVSYFNVKGITVAGGNAKYIFFHGANLIPNLAAGVIYMSSNTAETDLYLVATNRLGQSGTMQHFRATGGILYQKPNYSGSDSNFTAMTGLEYGVPGGTTLGFDYIFNDIAAGDMYGGTICQPITPFLSCKVGVGNRDRYYVGMTLKFGGK